MRRGLLAVVILGLLVAASAAATPATLPGLLAKQIRAINAAAKSPPVLLPRGLPLDAKHLHPSGGPVGKRYDLEIGFTPLSCGASCSPPQIVFVVHGVRYTIQANLKKTAKGDRATLIGAAESAIGAGPR
jgi:hypothetical protein